MAKKKAPSKKKVSKNVKPSPKKAVSKKAVKSAAKTKPKSKVKELVNTNPPPAPAPEPVVEKEVPPVDEFQTVHDFLTEPELIGAWSGSETDAKGNVTRHKFVKENGTKVSAVGSVPVPVAELKGNEIISIQMTGKDSKGNFNFVICELETGDKGFFASQS